ncbi:MAG: nucleotidyltransferase family protein [Acidobacteriota bacterium]
MTDIDTDAERLMLVLSDRLVATDTWDQAAWQRVADLAHQHALAPLLHAKLKQRAIAPPPDVAQRVRATYLSSAARNIRLFHELGKVLGALRASNVPVIPLKGAWLAEAVYGNIALRPMGDVDLLVPFADIAQTLAALKPLGYVPDFDCDPVAEKAEHHHLPPISRPGGLTLEIHWTIVDPIYCTRFDDDELARMWARAGPATVGGVAVRALSPTDQLLHLCVHTSAHHRFDGAGLRNYVDVAFLVTRFGGAIDWAQCAARANQWDVANGVRLALRLMEEFTGVVVPASVWAELAATPLDDATADWVRHKTLHRSAAAIRSNVALLEGKTGVVNKLVVLRDALFLSRAAMGRMYKIPATSWRILACYPRRFKDVWGRYRGQLWQVVRRDPAFVTEATLETRLREYLGWH